MASGGRYGPDASVNLQDWLGNSIVRWVAFLNGLVLSYTWLFYFHSMLKIETFYPVFPLTGFTDKAFFRLSLWIFKEKASTIFYNTAFLKAAVIAYGCFIPVIYWKYVLLFNFSLINFKVEGLLLAIPLELQEIKHQPFPMTRPSKKRQYTFYTPSSPPLRSPSH